MTSVVSHLSPSIVTFVFVSFVNGLSCRLTDVWGGNKKNKKTADLSMDKSGIFKK